MQDTGESKTRSLPGEAGDGAPLFSWGHDANPFSAGSHQTPLPPPVPDVEVWDVQVIQVRDLVRVLIEHPDGGRRRALRRGGARSSPTSVTSAGSRCRLPGRAAAGAGPRTTRARWARPSRSASQDPPRAGRRNFRGRLTAADDAALRLTLDDGADLELPRADVARSNIVWNPVTPYEQRVLDAVYELEQQKQIDAEVLLTALEDALRAAYKKTPEAARTCASRSTASRARCACSRSRPGRVPDRAGPAAPARAVRGGRGAAAGHDHDQYGEEVPVEEPEPELDWDGWPRPTSTSST